MKNKNETEIIIRRKVCAIIIKDQIDTKQYK